MKKLFYLVAVATLGLLSCQQEQDPVSNVVKNESVTFKASIENFATRATYDSGDLLWTSGDKIGVFFPNWTDNNQQAFTLSSGANSTDGVFKMDNNWAFSPSDATCAYFPYTNDNNVSGDNIWFTLPQTYGDNTSDVSNFSGRMYTPLVAKPSSDGTISFKHAGAAVKVTINNLPAHAHSIGMTVENQQIYGYYHVPISNIETNPTLVINDNTSNNTKNTIWYNFKNETTKADPVTFIFPVPTLTAPKLTVQIYDVNDVLVLSKTTKNSQPNLGRAQVLAMNAISITTPYSDYTETSSEWSVCGSFTSWSSDKDMITDATKGICIYKRNFVKDEEFKVRSKGSWTKSYGSDAVDPRSENVWEGQDGNIKMKNDGIFYVIFNTNKEKIIILSEENWSSYPGTTDNG